MEEACTDIDRALGEGVATPDHLLYVCPTTSSCPATEPEELPGGAQPNPGMSAEPRDGEGILVVIPDSGLLPGADTEHEWLRGVEGEPENPIGGYPPRILPYAGDGTFTAGVARAMAPNADVWVDRTFAKFGAIFEADLVKQISAALGRGAEIISLSFGTSAATTSAARLRDRGGKTAEPRRFGPGGGGGQRWGQEPVLAGRLSLGGGRWRAERRPGRQGVVEQLRALVDVFAPGEGLVNAFAKGDYRCTEPPNEGTWRKFDGMARWSGTSFSTPLSRA